MEDPTQTLWLIPAILAAFVIFFVCMWSLSVFIISLVGGWWRLAGHYRATMPFTGQRWSWQMGWLGWSRYRAVLTVGADTSGLYLEVMRIFRIGHPALWIPWTDITAEEGQWWLFPVMVFRFAQAPGVTLKLLRDTGEKALAARDGIIL
jgi:hypothetical protein